MPLKFPEKIVQPWEFSPKVLLGTNNFVQTSLFHPQNWGEYYWTFLS